MKRILCQAFAAVLTVSLFVGTVSSASAADYTGYTALDQSQPVSFDGKTVKWNGKTFVLDENTFFLDYRLQREQIAGNPYAFNTLKDAAAKMKDGTAAKPMMLLTAPGVYWVDDPDNPAPRGTADGGRRYGQTITCNNLYFYGLNSKWENVVFAVNRVQMFNIQGTGLKSENVTFGNYYNVDLKFPLVPSLGRARRADAIVQAELFNYSANDGVAINSAFVSRLNLFPFPRMYLNCHVESSGHAGGNSIYIDSTVELYGANFSGGRMFFNCDIYFKPSAAAMRDRSSVSFGFTDGIDAGGIIVDTRLHRSQEMIANKVALDLSWDRAPASPLTRGYQSNVTLDGRPYIIQEGATPGATVMVPAGSELLKAFKVTHNGRAYYNVPNIFPGMDPFGYTAAIKAAAKAAGKDENYYLNIPVNATLRAAGAGGRGGRGAGAPDAPAGAATATGAAAGPTPPGGRGGGVGIGNVGAAPLLIRSGQTTATLTANVAPAVHASSSALGKWQYTASHPGMVQLTPGANNTVTVTGTNNGAEAVTVVILAKNELGLEACARLTVEPAFMPPPTFAREPAITQPKDGRMTLDYNLGLDSNKITDESVITWYRTTDAQGSNPLKVAVSRRDKAETTYVVSDGDVGSYLMATIQPKHSLSEAGPLKTIYSRALIAKGDVKNHAIDTNFQNFPVDPQPKIIPGTWTVDDSWTYGQGLSGAIGYYGLYQTVRGARLSYTPVEGKYDDMAVRVKFAPNKNTGQGFGSPSSQYINVYIKYDFATNTGYALHIERLNTDQITAIGYKGAGAVAGCVFFLAKFENGTMTPVSKKVMSTAFVSECTVDLTAKNGRLLASVTSTEKIRSGDEYDYPREVQFDVPVESNSLGGTGMIFTGTVGVNAVTVTSWQASWPK